jgi:hypothetical protein
LEFVLSVISCPCSRIERADVPYRPYGRPPGRDVRAE